jgi:hypothetical protein
VLRVPSLLLFADVFFMGLALGLGSPLVGLAAAVLGAAVAVFACELLARDDRRPEFPREPWRLDGWAVTIGTLAVLGLAASIGPEAAGVAWLLVALIAGLGFASLPNLAARPRS